MATYTVPILWTHGHTQSQSSESNRVDQNQIEVGVLTSSRVFYFILTPHHHNLTNTPSAHEIIPQLESINSILPIPKSEVGLGREVSSPWVTLCSFPSLLHRLCPLPLHRRLCPPIEVRVIMLTFYLDFEEGVCRLIFYYNLVAHYSHMDSMKDVSNVVRPLTLPSGDMVDAHSLAVSSLCRTPQKATGILFCVSMRILELQTF